MEAIPGWRLTSFHDGHSALLALRMGLADDRTSLPHVVLMDFAMHPTGDDVTRAWRSAETDGYRATIIGHSTSRSASRQIVAVGGDTTLVKTSSSGGINQHLLTWLKARDAAVAGD